MKIYYISTEMSHPEYAPNPQVIVVQVRSDLRIGMNVASPHSVLDTEDENHSLQDATIQGQGSNYPVLHRPMWRSDINAVNISCAD